MSSPVALRGCLPALVAFVVVGCAAPPGDTGSTGSGQSVDAPHDAALLLLVDRGDALPSICSGSLLAPNVVLTARHCVVRDGGNDEGCMTGGVALEPSTVTVKLGVDALSSDVVAAKARRIVFPTKRGACTPDLAILQLDRAIEGIAPVTLATARPAIGATCTSVGYAPPMRAPADDAPPADEEPLDADVPVDLPPEPPANESVSPPLGKEDEEEISTPAPVAPSHARGTHRGLRVLEVGAASATYDDAKGEKVAYALRADELATGEAICGGDSGGPLFDERGCQIGVASRKPAASGGHCVGTPSIFMSVDAHGAWIREQIVALGGE